MNRCIWLPFFQVSLTRLIKMLFAIYSGFLLFVTLEQRLLSVFYSSSRNTRVFRHEIRAQSETCLHREYNLAMKNSLSYTMLHRSIVTHAQARRIAAAQRGRCFAPCAARQERRGVLELFYFVENSGKCRQTDRHSRHGRSRDQFRLSGSLLRISAEPLPV